MQHFPKMYPGSREAASQPEALRTLELTLPTASDVVAPPLIQSQDSCLTPIPTASERPPTTLAVSPLVTFSRPAGDELGEALSDTPTLEEHLRKVRGELYHLRWSAKDVAERAVQEALKQAKLPGFTGQAVQEIIDHVVEKVEENQVPMPDYALKSSGAAVIHSRTSPSLWNTKGKVFLYSLPLVDYVRSPEVILEPDNHPGNCWPFPGSQGHVLIKLSVPITPRAVTMDHVSGSAFHRDSIPSAPKDFAVYGLKEGREEKGTFLGEFTFLAALNPRQTFQLKLQRSTSAAVEAEISLIVWTPSAYKRPHPVVCATTGLLVQA
ncbi:SUN domain-containing protein 2-like [Grus americana]|uniref:SUN domain-containing protein 2-like n=1 Tax=Grus americana TaxID=9117 RepID=UPI002407EF3E|nr:SUN domain-containing protein 2-like [Grus americana]